MFLLDEKLVALDRVFVITAKCDIFCITWETYDVIRIRLKLTVIANSSWQQKLMTEKY